MILVFISSLLDLTLDTIGHTLSNSTQCMFDTSSVPAKTLPISPYWLLIRDLVYSIGYVLGLISVIETYLAQTPISFRGTATGLGTVIGLIAQSIRLGIISFISQFNLNKVTPSCGFYFCLVQSNPHNAVFCHICHFC